MDQHTAPSEGFRGLGFGGLRHHDVGLTWTPNTCRIVAFSLVLAGWGGGGTGGVGLLC